MNLDFKFVPDHYASRPHSKMKEVLMNPKGKGPSIHYYMIRGGTKQKNITVWEPGKVSGEYIKTYGHYHVGKLDENYWILYGTGIALLQKLSIDANDKMISDIVEEFKAITVKPGDKVYMPTGYGHLLVNTCDTYFVTADDSPVNFAKKSEASLPGHADYKPVQIMQGFAYYVIEHKGKPTLVKNPRYKKIIKQNLGGLPVLR